MAVIARPSLVEAIPRLQDPKVYGDYLELMRLIGVPIPSLLNTVSSEKRADPWPTEIQTAVRKLLLDYVGPSESR